MCLFAFFGGAMVEEVSLPLTPTQTATWVSLSI
jgi:hypothetical protein